MKSHDLSRRTFIKGAAFAGGASMLAGSLAACGTSPTNSTAQAQQTGSGAAGASAYTTINTDVLIVGAGSAGTMAAIHAAAQGASTIIVDKKAFGHCGDSGLHYSGRMTTSNFGVEGDSVDVHLEDAAAVGQYVVDQALGREILQAYYDDSVTLQSENMGNLHLRDPESGKPFVEKSVNRPRLWVGFKLNNLAYRAIENGTQVMDYVTVTSLITGEDGAVVGATALDFRTGAFIVFRAKSVILATGGDTGLWGAGTVGAKFGGGVESLTGDGHSLAAPLGVEFRDLEFRSMYSNLGVLQPSGISNLACLYSSDHINYTDAEGNTPLKEAKEAGTITMRTIIAEWYRAQLEGRATPSGGFYAPIDSYLLGLGNGSITAMQYPADLWDQLKIMYEKQGDDLSKAEVGPHLTYDYGGIVTDIDGFAGVSGLYAVGECAMHCGAGYGSFRMFSSAFVMGKRAGLDAAERAKTGEVGAFDWAQVSAEHDRVFGLLTAEPASPIRPHELKHRIQDTAWKGSGAMRSATNCAAALEELDAEEADLANLGLLDKSPVCNLEWMEALSLAHMIKMARLDTLASAERTESRGSHLRAEYPEMDNDNWCKNVYLKEVDGSITVEVRDTNNSEFSPKPGLTDLGGGVVEGM